MVSGKVSFGLGDGEVKGKCLWVRWVARAWSAWRGLRRRSPGAGASASSAGPSAPRGPAAGGCEGGIEAQLKRVVHCKVW